MGSLLVIITTQRNDNNNNRNAGIALHSIRQITLDDYMAIDAMTLSALQIFSTEHHPSSVRGRGRSKEGFSLYARRILSKIIFFVE